jgi:cytoskeletal protein CcmA (bactofilin family)
VASPGFRSDVAHIGKSVVIKGQLSGSEDLYLDGEVEGTVELAGNSLSVGPNGRIRANITSRELVIMGKVDGNIKATDRLELRKTGVLNGDVTTARIVIEDGAFFKGTVEILRAESKADLKPAPATAAAKPESPIPAPMSAGPGASPTGAAIAASYGNQQGKK